MVARCEINERSGNNGSKEWKDFKARHKIPTVNGINGNLRVYHLALKAFFKTGDLTTYKSVVENLNHGFFEGAHRRLIDQVLVATRKEIEAEGKRKKSN